MSFVRFADSPILTPEEWMAIFIRTAVAVDMPDIRGAAVCAAMCCYQEASADPHQTGQRQIWIPGNYADPCFAANPDSYPHDSISDDGMSTGPFQQQMGADWGWGGVTGDCDGTAKRMNAYDATRMFMSWPGSGLKDKGYDASTAQSANDAIQSVQQSGRPNAYAQWWTLANQLYGRATGRTPMPDTRPIKRPDFNEYPVWTPKHESRAGTVIDLWLMHTEQGTSNADELARWINDTPREVSYHYTCSQDYTDHGVTVCDIVDTDLAAWSVGCANRRSINFCFAGSYASWTREQWMAQSRAIDTAAYLAIQDCMKYGISPLMLVHPPFGSPTYDDPPGIADHRYAAVHLGCTTHTDVGPNFPWDYFVDRLEVHLDGPKPHPKPNPPTGPPKFPDDLTAKQLLNYIAAQLGPGDPAWTAIGFNDAGQPLTVRDAIGELERKVNWLIAAQPDAAIRRANNSAGKL